MFHKKITSSKNAANDAATNSLIALMNTAVITGFGGVVQGSQGFELVKEFALSLNMSPLISACLATALVAAACGSCFGGLSVFLAALGPQYVELCQAQGFPLPSCTVPSAGPAPVSTPCPTPAAMLPRSSTPTSRLRRATPTSSSPTSPSPLWVVC